MSPPHPSQLPLNTAYLSAMSGLIQKGTTHHPDDMLLGQCLAQQVHASAENV